MEQQILGAIDVIASYGAMGCALIFFMVKDWKQSDKLNQAIDKSTAAIAQFTSAVEMCNRRG